MAEIIPFIKNDGCFIPGRTYCFSPPVFTNCMLVSGNKGWEQKAFSEGWCLRFENGEGVFQGKSLNEKNVYFFKVIYGRGSAAVEKK